MNCPDCGEPVGLEASFCPKCFARIEPPGLWQKILSLFRGRSRAHRPIVNIRKSVTIKSTDAQGQVHEYHSLDEAPPELRAQIELLQNESAANTVSYRSSAGPINRIVTERKVTVYKIKDASGTEHTYHSLEELPPEIRAAIEQAGRARK